MLALVAGLTALSTSAYAQGFGIFEQGTCMMGRGGAGVASPCNDGSSIYFNPAGMVDDGGTASMTVTGIRPVGNFTNSSTSTVSAMNTNVYPVPAGYLTFPVTKTITGGIGIYAPYGLTADWPSNTEGRYVGYYSSIKSIYIQPSYATKIGKKMSIGVGFAFSRTSLTLQKKVDLSSQILSGTTTFAQIGVPKGTDFADVNLSGDKVTFGTNIGFLYKASDQFSLGIRYLGKQTVAISNGQESITQITTGLKTPVPLSASIPAGTPIDAILAPKFATGGALSNQTATTAIPLPMQLVTGVAISPNKDTKILVDLQYTRWSAFDTVTITSQYAPTSVLYENYGDTLGVRLGVEKQMMEGRGVLRFGFDVHNAAAPDQTVTPVLPEGSRQELNVGAGFRLSPKARLDVAYMYLHQPDRAGRTQDSGAAVPTTALNNGTYSYTGNLFAAGLVVKF